MAKTKFVISLSDIERSKLTEIIIAGTEAEPTMIRAKILLLSDVNHKPKLSIPKIIEATGVSRQTIVKIRSIYARRGFEIATHELQRGEKVNAFCHNKLLAEKIQKLITEDPPEGHRRWTVATVTDECNKRGFIESKATAASIRCLLIHFGISLNAKEVR